MGKRVECPWPGPKPYSENDTERFFGRNSEIEEVIGIRILGSRLSVLTGDSGAGKTSLLQAGVVPRLWAKRKKLGDHIPPTLVVRDWGYEMGTSFTNCFKYGLITAINHIIKVNIMAEKDVEKFEIIKNKIEKNEVKVNDAYGYISELCECFGGIILILDQFEELFRAKEDGVGTGATKLIEDVYRFGTNARVLISLRQEYYTSLRGLETMMSDFSNRVQYLERMQEEQFLTAVKAAAQKYELQLDDGVLERIFRLSDPKYKGSTSPDIDLESRDVNLIIRQALLHTIYQDIVNEKEERSITVADLDSYLHDLEESGVTHIVNYVMQRWINNAVVKPISGNSQVQTGMSIPMEEPMSELKKSTDEMVAELTDYLKSNEPQKANPEDEAKYVVNTLVRRTLIRIIPYLSAGSFKVLQEWKELWQRALEEDIDNIGNNRLSGIARLLDWDGQRAEKELQNVLKTTLARLCQENILKHVSISESNFGWELVHDSFAEPLEEWRRKQRIANWDECVHSLTASIGTEIKFWNSGSDTPSGEICEVDWTGAVIRPCSDYKLIENVVFNECIFSGTIFKNCHFKKVQFNNCELPGALFLNCTFDSVSGKPLFKGSIVKGLSFRDCIMGDAIFEYEHMISTIIENITLNGYIKFRAGNKDVARMTSTVFRQLEGDSESAGWLFDEKSDLEYCSWDLESDPFIDNKQNKQSMRNWKNCGLSK